MKQIAADPSVYQVELTPETVTELLEEYQAAGRPDLGRQTAVRVTAYQIDRIPAGSVLIRCPVCNAPHTAKPGDFALLAVFRFSVERVPDSVLMPFWVCPACAKREAPNLAAEIYTEP